MTFALVGLVFGGLAGFFVGKMWAAVVVILAPLPWYLGIALELWGNGFGENWQYTVPIWVLPAFLGFIVGALARNAKGRRPEGRKT